MPRVHARFLPSLAGLVAVALAVATVAPAADPIPVTPPATPAPIKTAQGVAAPDDTAASQPSTAQNIQQSGAQQPLSGVPGEAPRGANESGSQAQNAGSQASVVGLGGAGNNQPAGGSTDLGELLSKSAAAAGVEVQRRSAITSDPRIRGFHIGQVVTYGDNGFFFPARQDLDTAISKFDPGSIRDIIIVKGPYSVRYGPGFSFLDIATLDAPRYEKGFELHGRTAFNYQTNGDRWDGLQSIYGGDKDWGFRATYNLLAGNDYKDGNGNLVAGSYNSQNTNFAVGVNLDCNSSLEFKGVRVRQTNVEFPGLYFDIDNLDTEAYSLRYTQKHGGYFDLFTADAWYNTTVVDGSTRQGNKQTFLSRVLTREFSADLAGQTLNGVPLVRQIQDLSSTHIQEHSMGYRLAATWGEASRNDPTLTFGTDFNYVSQGLRENIVYRQTSGPNLNTGTPTSPTNPATFTNNPFLPNTITLDPGVFLDARIPLTRRLNVNAGMRFDWTNARAGSRLITGDLDVFGPAQVPGGTVVSRTTVDPILYSSAPNNPSTSREFDLFAGYVNGDYKIDEHLTAIGGFGFSQRAPTPTELYAAGPFIGVLQQGLSRLIGDPNLEKETLREIDFGLRADYDWFRGGASGFYAWVDNYITFDLNKGSTSGGNLNQVVFSNTDSAVLAGGELFGEVDATHWLTPFASASYVQGRDRTHRDDRRPGNIASSRREDETEPLPGIPPLELRYGLRFHESIVRKAGETPKRPKWQFEFSARSVFAQNAVATSIGELETPYFVTYDFRSYYQVTKGLLLTAGVENIGDRFYREHLDPRAGNFDGNPLYRQGTNFYFGTQWTY